jgi:hypothetical protein
VTCQPETAGAEGTAAIRRGALQRWRHLRSVKRGTLVHTDSGGDFTVVHARESYVRQLRDRVLIDMDSDRPPPQPQTTLGITATRRATEPTMSMRAWPDSYT